MTFAPSIRVDSLRAIAVPISATARRCYAIMRHLATCPSGLNYSTTTITRVVIRVHSGSANRTTEDTENTEKMLWTRNRNAKTMNLSRAVTGGFLAYW